MENYLALNNETSDEAKFSKEAIEEPHIVEVPLKYMDSVLENQSPTLEKSKQHEIVDAKVEYQDKMLASTTQFEVEGSLRVSGLRLSSLCGVWYRSHQPMS